MDPNALAFFEEILKTPSPSGFESPLQQVVEAYAGGFADEISTDVHGTAVRAQKARDHFHGRRFTGTVWSEKSQDFAGRNAEGDVVHRFQRPELFREMADLDHVLSNAVVEVAKK